MELTRKVPIEHLGYRLRVWWPLEDGTAEPYLAELSAVKASRKRKFQLRFEGGESVWCSLDRKRLRFELAPTDDWIGSCPMGRKGMSASRPLYIGSTDPAYVRDWIFQSLRGVLPSSEVDAYYMCVGGLSGFDGIVGLRQDGVRVRRVVLFDRDETALAYAEVMLSLIRSCITRAEFIHAVFGRCPDAWARAAGHEQLSAGSMHDFLQTDVDVKFIREKRRSLPKRLRALYNVIVRAAAYGCDVDGFCDILPRRRVWPCWGPHRRTEVGVLAGGADENFHYGETGWLKDDSTYRSLRDVLCDRKVDVAMERMDLNQARMRAVAPRYFGHVLFISNADENSKFLRSRASLEKRISEQCAALVISSLKLTLVTMGSESSTLLSQRSGFEWSCDQGAVGIQCSKEGLVSLRKFEMLRHLESTRDPTATECEQWRCKGIQDHWWRFTRMLAVLNDDSPASK